MADFDTILADWTTTSLVTVLFVYVSTRDDPIRIRNCYIHLTLFKTRHYSLIPVPVCFRPVILLWRWLGPHRVIMLAVLASFLVER